MQDFFETHSYLTQIFGFSAMAVGIIMYQFKKHRTIMVLMTLCSALWCLHYTSMWLFTPRGNEFFECCKKLCLQPQQRMGSFKGCSDCFYCSFTCAHYCHMAGSLGNIAVYCFNICHNRRLAKESADFKDYDYTRLPLLGDIQPDKPVLGRYDK